MRQINRTAAEETVCPDIDSIRTRRRLRSKIEKLYDRYGCQMYSCALAVLGCSGLAEDAVQDAFCKGLRMKTEPDNLKAYIFKSVRNAAIDILRKRGRMSGLPEEYDYIFSVSHDPGNEVEIQQLKKTVVKNLMRLNEDERETIVQHIYAGLTFQEIADIRDKPLGTVTSWYRRGIARMKKSMRY